MKSKGKIEMKNVMTSIALLFFFIAGTADAAGGKNRHENPVIADGPDNCIYLIPTGLDDEKCWELSDIGDNALSGVLCTIGDPDTAIELCPEIDDD